MHRITTPTLIAALAIGGTLVEQPYSVIVWTLAAVAAGIWIASEVIRWRRAQ